MMEHSVQAKNKLALFGGAKTRPNPFPPHPVLGGEEREAVLDVLQSGKLSSFLAMPGEGFLGGRKIREFEKSFQEFFGVRYAVAFNSATAALHAAVAACGVEPGEEVITTPYSFTASASSILMHNAIPVFSDVTDDDYGLNPDDIERKISPLTRAIMLVHLFGNPARVQAIKKIADKHHLKLIEDCAQAIGASSGGRWAGTFGDCGIFSFTETKTVTSGEGGMLITNDEQIAEISRLIRNHGEAVVLGEAQRAYNSKILGWNYRMTEIDAAVGLEQFKKLESFNQKRIELAHYLTKKLSAFKGIIPPIVREGDKHVYWMYAFQVQAELLGIHRNTFVEAFRAEGIPCAAGYIRPLYLSDMFQKKEPFVFKHYRGNTQYGKGLCPVAEKLFEELVVNTIIVRPTATFEDMDSIAEAVVKIYENLETLKAYEAQRRA